MKMVAENDELAAKAEIKILQLAQKWQHWKATEILHLVHINFI
jgi:hypothetical protein